jgi:hypothetical protein
VHLNYLDATIIRHHEEPKIMEQRKSKRSLRVALILGVAVTGTALVGWGGLAAWNAYTMNAGNSVAAGTLTHAQSAACVSSLGTIPISTSGQGGGWCNAAVTITGINSSWSGGSATFTVANTGNLASTFYMSMTAAASGSLCPDLKLAITDPDSGGPGTVLAATALTSSFVMTSTQVDNGSSQTSWTGGGTAGTGAGATGNTFTLALTPGTSYATDSTDAGTNCTFNILVTQAA